MKPMTIPQPAMPHENWCPYPYHYAMITPNLEVRPCCRYDSHSDPTRLQIQSMSQISTVLQEDLFTNLRTSLKNGTIVKGCSTCFREEQSGILSLRQKTIYEKTLPTTLEPVLTSMEIGVGRTCNLKCRTCNSQYSTKWDADEKQLGWGNTHFHREIDANLEAFPRDLFASLTEVKITGGEPFLNKSLDVFIQNFVDSGYSNNCTLEIFTNCTLFPKDSTLKNFSRFKASRISLSIDGLEEKNNYIRHPSEWSIVNKNIENWRQWQKQSSNHAVWLAHTICIFNIADSFKFLNWADTFWGKQSKVVFQILHGPSYLSVYKLPNKIKNSIYKKLHLELDGKHSHLKIDKHQRNIEKIFSLLKHNDTDDDQGFKDEFLYHTQALDQLRGEDYSNVFPELAAWIEQC